MLSGPRLRLSTFTVRLTAAQQRELDAILRRVNEAGPAALRFVDVIQPATELVSLLLNRGELVRYGDLVSTPAVLDGVRDRVSAFLDANERMLPTDFKAMYGLSRKHAIPMLSPRQASPWFLSLQCTVEQFEQSVNSISYQ